MRFGCISRPPHAEAALGRQFLLVGLAAAVCNFDGLKNAVEQQLYSKVCVHTAPCADQDCRVAAIPVRPTCTRQRASFELDVEGKVVN